MANDLSKVRIDVENIKLVKRDAVTKEPFEEIEINSKGEIVRHWQKEGLDHGLSK